MTIKPSQKNIDIEKAITMLVDCVNKKNRNPKPLILHSIRVGMKLFELNQPKEIIIAGFLHDLLEDTNCKINDIKKNFGAKVANIVLAHTKEKIKDRKERWNALLRKIKKAGRGAMLIKIVDNNDNLIYLYPLFRGRKIKEATLWKYNFTIDSLKPFLGNIKVFKEHQRNYILVNSKFKSS